MAAFNLGDLIDQMDDLAVDIETRYNIKFYSDLNRDNKLGWSQEYIKSKARAAAIEDIQTEKEFKDKIVRARNAEARHRAAAEYVVKMRSVMAKRVDVDKPAPLQRQKTDLKELSDIFEKLTM